MPVALLIGFAFGAVGMAATTWIRGISDFDYVQLGLIPMMLLSATFFPVDDLSRPDPLAGELSPLYHGVALERGLMLGQVGWSLVAHLLVLLALGAVGMKVLSRRLARPAVAVGEHEPVRSSEFWELMRAEFGAAYAGTLAREHVVSQLGERTAEQALAAGIDPREVLAGPVRRPAGAAGALVRSRRPAQGGCPPPARLSGRHAGAPSRTSNRCTDSLSTARGVRPTVHRSVPVPTGCRRWPLASPKTTQTTWWPGTTRSPLENR